MSSSRPRDKAIASSSCGPISPALSGMASVLLGSSVKVVWLGVCDTAGNTRVDAVLFSLLTLLVPLVSATDGVSFSFFLLRVLTIGWS